MVADILRELRPGKELGPMITRDQYQTGRKCFDAATREGMQAEVGGSLPDNEALHGGFNVNQHSDRPVRFSDGTIALASVARA